MLEGLIRDIRLFIGLVGDGPQDDKGDLIEIGGMGNGGSFHFRAECMEGVHKPVLLLCRADELVAAHNAALVDADSGDGFFACRNGGSAHLGRSGEIFESPGGAHLRDDTGLIAKDCDIHVVIHGIFGYHDVTDIDVVVKRTGDAGVDQMCDLKAVDQNLSTDGCVDLADSAFYDDNVGIAEAADMKYHACFFHGLGRSHLFLGEFPDFKIHGADNADFHSDIILQSGASCVAG